MTNNNTNKNHNSLAYKVLDHLINGEVKISPASESCSFQELPLVWYLSLIDKLNISLDELITNHSGVTFEAFPPRSTNTPENSESNIAGFNIDLKTIYRLNQSDTNEILNELILRIPDQYRYEIQARLSIIYKAQEDDKEDILDQYKQWLKQQQQISDEQRYTLRELKKGCVFDLDKEKRISIYFLNTNSLIIILSLCCLLIGLFPGMIPAVIDLTSVVIISLVIIYLSGILRFINTISPTLKSVYHQLFSDTSPKDQDFDSAKVWLHASVIIASIIVIIFCVIVLTNPVILPWVVISDFISMSGFLAFAALAPLSGNNAIERHLNIAHNDNITFPARVTEMVFNSTAISLLTLNMFLPLHSGILAASSAVLIFNVIRKLIKLQTKINDYESRISLLKSDNVEEKKAYGLFKPDSANPSTDRAILSI
tara:strand:+ start:551 stop:1831 length:1281 start_codon:yes stop_codon:yes gene_type:complete